jgi:hypothetical protein
MQIVAETYQNRIAGKDQFFFEDLLLLKPKSANLTKVR